MTVAKPRRWILGAIAAVVLVTVGADTMSAVELRGRIDGMNPANGLPFPLANAQVEIFFNGQPVARALTGFDGFYYFSNIQPGMHELVVNRRIRLPVLIQPQPYQDIPPVLVQ